MSTYSQVVQQHRIAADILLERITSDPSFRSRILVAPAEALKSVGLASGAELAELMDRGCPGRTCNKTCKGKSCAWTCKPNTQ
jgi:hypothetical protein